MEALQFLDIRPKMRVFAELWVHNLPKFYRNFRVPPPSNSLEIL
jgi:hypothetical protein